MLKNSMWWHWAYRPENQGTHADIRQYLHETEVIGWSVYRGRDKSKGYEHAIMCFDHTIMYRDKIIRVYFLEEWYTKDGHPYHINRLFSDVEGITL